MLKAYLTEPMDTIMWCALLTTFQNIYRPSDAMAVDQLVVLFEVGEDKAFEETSVLVALKTPGGQKLEELAASKIRHLQV